MKIIWHRISIQTLLFQACLPTRQNREKAYYVRDLQALNITENGITKSFNLVLFFFS